MREEGVQQFILDTCNAAMNYTGLVVHPKQVVVPGLMIRRQGMYCFMHKFAEYEVPPPPRAASKFPPPRTVGLHPPRCARLRPASAHSVDSTGDGREPSPAATGNPLRLHAPPLSSGPPPFSVASSPAPPPFPRPVVALRS